jgi:hypothetical protein
MIKSNLGILPILCLILLGAGWSGCSSGGGLPEVVREADAVGASGAEPQAPPLPNGGTGQEAPPHIPDSEVYALSSDIYQNYGELRVWAGERTGESAVKPWSGYWLPARSKYLFEGAKSPFVLWDRFIQSLVASRSLAGVAADWEKSRYEENPQALSWEGACDAWAIASLYENEPVDSVRLGPELSLSIGAQKALLVRSWDWVDGKRVYGRPYRGDRESHWDEPNPAAFHRFMQSELFEQARPFIVDKDPGIPVWNTPVYAAVSDLSDDPEDPNSVLVRTWLKGVDPLFKNPDEIRSYIVWIELAYRLTGIRESDGSLLVKGGAWIKDENTGVDSTQFHPDFLVGLPPQGQVPAHGSFNPGVQQADWLEFRGRLGLSYREP